jgi:hypothetical protein
MKNTEFKKRLKTYIANNSNLDAKIEKLLRSNCIDLENKQDDYMLEKASAYAILLSIAEDFRPLASQTMQEAKNIQKFI